MIGDEIEQHPEAAGVRLAKQAVEVGERAEARVDPAIIGDVIAEIGHRRGEDRRDPHGVDPKRDEVVEARLDAAKVADAVAVAVRERARVDLVDHARLPPLICRHANRLLARRVIRQARSASPLATR